MTTPPTDILFDLDEPLTIQRALAAAARLGFDDHVRLGRAKTGLEIIKKLGCVRWRQGHKRYLKSAYEAGAFSAKMALNPES